MKKIFHPGFAFVVRLVLGAVLLYASYHKIADPPDFAKVIYNYKLFPSEAINLLAIFMPWAEVVAGLALITGVGRRGAALLAGLLFFGFIAILSFNLARGCPTVCGCFDTYAAGQDKTDLQKFGEMRREILLVDVPCLLLSIHAFAASFIRRPSA